jgi:galactose mutarotase-like enzyme
VTLRAADVAGFRGLALANDSLEVQVLPELGGKLVSLVSRASGREWLWRNPHLPLRAAGEGDSYVALHDTGGVDECLPNVAPSHSLRDHGELWGRPWQVEAHDEERLTLAITVHERFRLRRTLRLPPGRAPLAFEYELENLADRVFDLVWCLHALLAVTPGMRIELPEATPLRVASLSGALPPDVSLVPDPATGARFAAKLFAGPLARGSAGLRSADGREALRFHFDPRELPFVGIWLNCAGWSGAGTPPYFNLGLEPGIGDADALEEALRRGTAARLAPHATRRFSLQLAVERSDPSLA